MELIDTHCHLTFDEIACDIDAILARSIAAGVNKWITIGTDPQHNSKAVELAEKFDNIYAAIGIHPHDAKDVTGETIAELKELAQHEKVVAIGETDFRHTITNRPRAESAGHRALQAGFR